VRLPQASLVSSRISMFIWRYVETASKSLTREIHPPQRTQRTQRRKETHHLEFLDPHNPSFVFFAILVVKPLLSALRQDPVVSKRTDLQHLLLEGNCAILPDSQERSCNNSPENEFI